MTFGLCIKLGGALRTVMFDAEVVVGAAVVPGGATAGVEVMAGNRGGGADGGRISLGGGIPETIHLKMLPSYKQIISHFCNDISLYESVMHNTSSFEAEARVIVKPTVIVPFKQNMASYYFY